MKKYVMAILFGSVLVLSACGGGGEEDGGSTDNGEDTQTEENGGDSSEDAGGDSGGEVNTAEAEKLYKQNCASCHANDLSGNVGPSLKQVGSKLDKSGIKEIIINGKGSMPPKQLEGQEAETVAAWLAMKK
ncbi:cytochrome c551 [Pontibacillus yanchengensis]|uniref:Cytochrome C551 n=1 Tax=Pontibacillus yanchengensis Y32 TaxID=1385514 RepID=A0A0A2THL8_9BACI|nr:cytochrome c [Pontibacillus yanchengensis]KGP73576.1 cytochrome C551 [Pontibacillus yanchengensis Y32]